MVLLANPNYFNDYLTTSNCQFIKPLYTFKHKKKTAKLTAFNLITNKNKYYGCTGASNVSISLSCR